MDAGIASTLLFVYPVMVAVIMAVLFKERLSAAALFAIVLALVGIALLYNGDGGVRLSTAGVLLVMLSSLSHIHSGGEQVAAAHIVAQAHVLCAVLRHAHHLGQFVCFGHTHTDAHHASHVAVCIHVGAVAYGVLARAYGDSGS